MKTEFVLFLNTVSKRLWLGFLLYSLIFIPVIVIHYPYYYGDAYMGLALGAFYQWSLLKSVSNPTGKWQALGSLVRIAVLGFVIVWLGQGDLTRITIVIFGCLSYKGGALSEVIYQAWLLPWYKSLESQLNDEQS